MKTFNIKKSILLALSIVSFSLFSCEKEAELCAYDELEIGCSAGMDVAFLIDYTGSMGGAINSIKSEVSNIVNTIVTESGGDYRLALGIFDEAPTRQTPAYFTSAAYTGLPANQKIVNTTGPNTHQYLTIMEKFAPANETSFGTQLAYLNNAPNMPMGGGNGFAEPGGMLLNEILSNNFAGTWRSGNITKLAIIITDAPDGGDDDNADATDDAYLQNLASIANSMGVQCILLTTHANSNYELQLISNNVGASVSVSGNFDKISQEIIEQIENICNN